MSMGVDAFSCPTCLRPSDPRGTWRCVWCDRRICERCYHEHTRDLHPDELEKIPR